MVEQFSFTAIFIFNSLAGNSKRYMRTKCFRISIDNGTKEFSEYPDECPEYWIIKKIGLLKTKELLLQLTDFIRVVDISHKHLLEALHSSFKDVEGSLHYFTALQHHMNYLATFNKKDFRNGKGTIIVATPQEILNLIK